jgi:hypothetical protein
MYLEISILPPDPIALASLEGKFALAIDRVTSVAHGLQTGFYFYGPGGLGKTYVVLNHLRKLEVPFRLFNSRITAKGLFEVLQKYPDAIHVFDDCERLTLDRDAQGILRTAMHAQPGSERKVTWTTATKGEEYFVFTGGIIILANRKLADLPELNALSTRIPVMHLDVTEAELEARMRDIARQGFVQEGKTVLDAQQCGVITEYIIDASRKAGRPLHLRQLTKGYLDYLLWDQDHSTCDWRDLITSNIREDSHGLQHMIDTSSREDRKAARRHTVKQILLKIADPAEQLKEYMKITGKSRADYYRRKAELDSNEFEEE